MDREIAAAYESKNNALDSRRKSHGAIISSQKKIPTIGVAVGKQINPLPPIEQYQLYQPQAAHNTMSHFGSSMQTLPVKKNRNIALQESKSAEKIKRDAMVNDIFANKK